LQDGIVQIERIAIGLRPRSGWESLDLGFQMSRRWWRQVWGIWLALYIPTAVVVLSVFSNKFYAVLLLWWLKPLFDRAVLHGFSRLAFGEQCGVVSTLRAAREWMRPGMFVALTLRRFELARSFALPISSLENQTGKSARKRRTLLGSRMRNNAVWLTVVCLHLEWITVISLSALGEMLIPSGGDIPMDDGSGIGRAFFFGNLLTWNLTEAICYVGAVSLIEPFYVAAGFSLYLNRRTILEGWDIEIQLRRLSNRLLSAAKSAAAVLVCCVLLIVPESSPLLAAETTQASASEEIARVLAEPEFDQYKEVKRWRWVGDDDEEETEPQSPEWAHFWANLAKLLSDIWQGLMWVAIAILVLIAIYILRKFIPGPRVRKSGDYEPPANLFGLDVSPESLPEDIGAAASVLVRQGRLRDALSLLYRGALSVLIHRHRVIVRAGDTEGDCERAAQAGLPSEASGYFSRLLAIWRQAAYAGSETESQTIDELCRDWALYFSQSGSAQRAQS
jgi:hypothetical protein